MRCFFSPSETILLWEAGFHKIPVGGTLGERWLNQCLVKHPVGKCQQTTSCVCCRFQELRSYATPPDTIKKVLQAVLVLLGEKKVPDWDTIKSWTRREDFIPSIREFNSKNITESASRKLKSEFMGVP